jgi:hypothetical protein
LVPPMRPELRQFGEHIAAPTNATNVKKILANPEPSTHGTNAKCHNVRCASAIGGKAIKILSTTIRKRQIAG